MDVPLILVLAAAAIAAWALLFRGMDQALPSRTRELRNRLGSGAEARPQRERAAPAGRPPLHPALVLALLLAVLAVGILIGQERQGLGATQEPTAEVSGESGAGGGEDTEDSGKSGDDGSGGAEDREDADKGAGKDD
jgi:hypothetical protein